MKNIMNAALSVFVAGFLTLGIILPGDLQAAAYPEKGRPVTVLLPNPAGGSSDTTVRLLTPILEKELGTPVQVVNKTGAGLQVGTTEFVRARPDGYTVGYVVIPTVMTTYLNPERKAIFTRKSFELLALLDTDPGIIAVKGNSPYKTLQDVINAAKANPEKIKTTTSGILSDDHISAMETEKLAGVKFAIVHFDGGVPGRNAVMGGHVEVFYGNVADVKGLVTSGELRILAVLDRSRSKYYPDVKTAEELGYKIYSGTHRGFVLQAAAPKEAISVMTEKLNKAINSKEYQTKMESLGYTPRYMDPAGFANLWSDYEGRAKDWVEWVKEKK